MLFAILRRPSTEGNQRRRRGTTHSQLVPSSVPAVAPFSVPVPPSGQNSKGTLQREVKKRCTLAKMRGKTLGMQVAARVPRNRKKTR